VKRLRRFAPARVGAGAAPGYRAPVTGEPRPPGDRMPPGMPPPVAPPPQPERLEPRVHDPGIRDLSARDVGAAVARAVREAVDDNIPALAAALAFRGFLAIPAALLAAVGTFGVVADPGTVTEVVDRLGGTLPPAALVLVQDSLERVTENASGSVTAIVVGAAVAIWTILGSMTTLMWALNVVYERRETRGFLRQRAVAALMFVLVLLAVALTFALLVLGPWLADATGSALGAGWLTQWGWWVAQWPIHFAGLLAVFAGILYLGPDVDHPRWRFITPGSLFAVVAWILVSAGFALFVATLDSYDRVWGSLAGVIVTQTWLWLSSIALLFGAQLNAEFERSRELRRSEPAEYYVQAPPRG
jgi:membrane protein